MNQTDRELAETLKHRLEILREQGVKRARFENSSLVEVEFFGDVPPAGETHGDTEPAGEPDDEVTAGYTHALSQIRTRKFTRRTG